MTALSSDCRALYAAILDDPEDDTARLVWADALEEAAGEIDCSRCTGTGVWIKTMTLSNRMATGDACFACSGSGRIPDGLAARAEFVRVQIENERKRGDGAFNHRESALLSEHEASWRRGARCERCKGDGFQEGRRAANGYYTQPRCPACHGSGWMGSLAELGERGLSIGNIAPPWRHKADWQRGLIYRVHAPLADIWTGDGPSEWAVRVRGEWPCEMFQVTDREPGKGDSPLYFWQRQSVTYRLWPAESWRRQYSVPDKLFDAMPGPEEEGSKVKLFDSPDAARTALALAIGELVGREWKARQRET